MVDTYGEGDAKSLAPTGMEREEKRVGEVLGRVSFREFGMPQGGWALLIEQNDCDGATV